MAPKINIFPVFMAGHKLRLAYNRELLDDSQLTEPKNIVIWIEEFEKTLSQMGLSNRGILSRREILNWLVKNINAQENLEKYIKEIGEVYQFLKQIDQFNFTSTTSKLFVLDQEDSPEEEFQDSHCWVVGVALVGDARQFAHQGCPLSGRLTYCD